jgi:hypothetical protein
MHGLIAPEPCSGADSGPNAVEQGLLAAFEGRWKSSSGGFRPPNSAKTLRAMKSGSPNCRKRPTVNNPLVDPGCEDHLASSYRSQISRNECVSGNSFWINVFTVEYCPTDSFPRVE